MPAILRLSGFPPKISKFGAGLVCESGGVPDSDRLLSDARSGSPEALGRAFEACRRYLLLVAEKKLGAEMRAKGGASDLVQETFLEAQRDFRRFRGESPGEFRVWLRRILLNNLGTFARQYRDTGKREVAREVAINGEGSRGVLVFDVAAPPSSPSAKLVAREQAEALRAALDRLSDDYRKAITLRLEGNLTFEELGRELGRSQEAARKIWVRAMESLRDEWACGP